MFVCPVCLSWKQLGTESVSYSVCIQHGELGLTLDLKEMLKNKKSCNGNKWRKNSRGSVQSHDGRDGTTGPSHVCARNDFPGQMRGKPIERSGVVAMSFGLAVLNGDGPSPWLVAWDGRPWALREQMEVCYEKAE